MDIEKLLQLANEAREKSYSPYSEFSVGAALLCADGKVFLGCNIENSSYGLTCCAERVAFFKAISEGYKDFKAIAIVGAKVGESATDPCFPCGACRQVMIELGGPELRVVLADSLDKYKIFKVEQLIPYSFLL